MLKSTNLVQHADYAPSIMERPRETGPMQFSPAAIGHRVIAYSDFTMCNLVHAQDGYGVAAVWLPWASPYASTPVSTQCCDSVYAKAWAHHDDRITTTDSIDSIIKPQPWCAAHGMVTLPLRLSSLAREAVSSAKRSSSKSGNRLKSWVWIRRHEPGFS